MIYTYIEAPNLITLPIGVESIFLAGGITGVEDWQARAVDILRGFGNITICNPRRKVWNPKADKNEVEGQIRWEYMYLRWVSQVLFWFGEETLQPIALFELGSRVTENCEVMIPKQKLFIGCHPNYQRKFDLEIQLPLMGYKKPIVSDLDLLLQQVLDYNRQLQLVR